MAGVRWVDPGDVSPRSAIFSYQFIKRSQRINLRKPGLERLLHCRDSYFLKTFRLDKGALRMVAFNECDPVDAELNSLLDKPFNAVCILGGGYRNVDMKISRRFGNGLTNFKRTVPLAGISDHGVVEGAHSISDPDGIAHPLAEHPDAMPGLLF